MSKRPTLPSLDQRLAALRPETASEDFTDRVLAALDARSARPARARVAAAGWAAAAVVALTLILGAALAYQRQRAADEAYQRQVHELRTEYQQLLEEMAAIRSQASEPPIRLYLGGDERLDLVLDLEQPEGFYTSADRPRPDQVRPANWEQ